MIGGGDHDPPRQDGIAVPRGDCRQVTGTLQDAAKNAGYIRRDVQHNEDGSGVLQDFPGSQA